MLDPKNGLSPFIAQSGHMEAEEPSTSEMISNIIGVIRRRSLVVVILGIIGAALGAAFLLKSEPQFTATATLLINTHKFEIFQQPTVSEAVSMQSAGAVESQVELLRSNEVALRVIRKLDLGDNATFIKHARQNFIAQFLHKLFPNYYTDTLSDIDRQNLALVSFNDNLSVERVGATYAIEIKYQSTDQNLAADVANAVADAYIDLQRTSENAAARQASAWLEERIPEFRAKSEAAQQVVAQYKQEHNIIETTGGQLIEDQRLADITLKVNAARDETLKAKARVDQLDSMKVTGFPGSFATGSSANSSTSESLEKLRSQYFEIAAKLAQSGNLGVNNPAMVSVRNQEAQLRSAITEQIQLLRQTSESDYAAAQQREANLNKEFDTAVAEARSAKQAQVKLQELQSTAHAYQDLYGTYVARYNASIQQALSPIAEATIITPATPLIPRNYKKSIQKAVLFPIAGVMLGLGIAVLRELLADRVFLTSRAVQSRLRIACIGLLPKIQAPKRIGRRSKKAREVADPKALVRGDREIAWTVVERPFSQFSEGVRSIKFAIDLENRSRTTRVVGITSALAHEGKSTVALAVAQMIASNGASTILVDCDLRNPSLTRAIAPNATAGIIELALGRTSLEDIVRKDPTTELAFIPAIPCAAPPDPPSLLSSAEMRQVFDKLREKYQFVIVDLSPLVPVIDVCATTDFIDAFVLVIEWGRTTVDIVKRALRAAPPVSEAIIGAVLNQADVKKLTTHDPYAMSYYYFNDENKS